jgi:hypothetical protein
VIEHDPDRDLESAVLAVVHRHCQAAGIACSPDARIDFFHGEDAEDLIYEAAARIGVQRSEVDRHFPFAAYFEPEGNIARLPFVMAARLFRRGPTVTREPLTALGLARLLVGLRHRMRAAS